jgi:hypothetical protein
MKRVVFPALVVLAGSTAWIQSPEKSEQPGVPRQPPPATAAAVNRGQPPDPREPVVETWFSEAKAGAGIAVPMPGGRTQLGRINLVRHDGGWRRIGGTLATGESLSLSTRGGEVRGLIQSRREGRSWRISTDAGGTLVFAERPLREIACMTLPQPKFAPVESATEEELRAPVPPLSSRPNVSHVLYLDFDGAIVNDPDWDFGNTIDAPKARMSPRNIQRVWQRVAADFIAFNIDVTTNAARYASADVGKRMRCIITRNDQAQNGAGGVAFIDSFSAAGDFFSTDIPSWVFIDRSVDACAEAISHELGHTLGLDHDGRDGPFGHDEYYDGQGRGPTGWAPIMGVSYYKRLSQWSKGEYFLANNLQDDIARITRMANGFGFAADETGGGIAGATTLETEGHIVSQDGIILNDQDVDVFRFEITGGKVQVRVKPGSGEANVDLQLELLDSVGNVLDTGNPPKSLSAVVSKQRLAAGTYYLRVRGVGKGDPLASGYTAYGCIGTYRLVGKVLGLATQN